MLTLADKGGGVVWTHPFLADIFWEQPLMRGHWRSPFRQPAVTNELFIWLTSNQSRGQNSEKLNCTKAIRKPN